MPAPKPVKALKIPGVDPPERECEDPNCPWHGSLRVRGILLEGTVVKVRAKRMAVIRHEYLYYDPKYKRYARRSKKIHAHLPDCISINPGDRVVIGETRPISKTVKFVVLGIKKSS
ncbi:MAG: 30S ribosomal protein S17 [Crenarchaeota archaeon]|nr:30S ribosomal protein S17 [Thermoproteota archaeon]